MVSFTLNPEDLESSLWPVKVLLTVTGLFPGGPLLRKLYNAAVSLVIMATGTMHIIFNFYHGMDLIVLCHFIIVSVSYCSIMAHIYNMLLGKTNFVEFFVSTMAEVDRNILERPKREYRRSTILQLVIISCVAGFFAAAGFFCFDRVWLILPSTYLFFYASLSLTMVFSVIFNIYVITLVFVLGERFRAVNMKLKEPLEQSPSVSYLDLRPPNLRSRGGFIRRHVSGGCSNARALVVRLMKLHSQLSDVVEFMNTLFGFPILLDVVSSFAVVVMYLYYSVPSNVVLYRSYSVDDAVVTAALLSFANFSKVALLIYHCESASSEANGAARIIYKIKLFSADDVGAGRGVRNLKIDAEVSQVKFSGCGFFSLDFSFLGSLVTAITTYLVILLQYGH